MEQTSAAFYSCPPTGGQPGIHFGRNVIDRLAHDIERTFRELPNPGAEIGGILLGTAARNGDATSVDDYRIFPCGYRRGPLYLLSEEEKRRLCDAARTPGAIGFFRSHTRRSLALTEEDLSIIRGCFPDSGCVCLLIKPFLAKPPLAAVFICGTDAAANRKPDFEFPFRVADLSAVMAAPDAANGRQCTPKNANPPAPVPGRDQLLPQDPDPGSVHPQLPPDTSGRRCTPINANPAAAVPGSDQILPQDPDPSSVDPQLPPDASGRQCTPINANPTNGPGLFASIGVHRRPDTVSAGAGRKRKLWWLSAAAVILLGAVSATLYFRKEPPPLASSNTIVSLPAPVSEPREAPPEPDAATPPSQTRQTEPVSSASAEPEKQRIPARQITLPPAKRRTLALPDPPRIDSSLNLGVPVPAVSTLRAPAPPAPRPPAGAGPEPGARDTNPVVAIATAPVYPAAARSSRAQGIVVVRATVDETGHVRAVTVLGGPPLLHQAAADAVKRYLFYPAARNGVPVEATTQVEVRFSRPN